MRSDVSLLGALYKFIYLLIMHLHCDYEGLSIKMYALFNLLLLLESRDGSNSIVGATRIFFCEGTLRGTASL